MNTLFFVLLLVAMMAVAFAQYVYSPYYYGAHSAVYPYAYNYAYNPAAYYWK